MISIFSNMVGEIMEVFMDDLSVFGDDCLDNLGKVLARCEEKNLCLIGRSVILWCLLELS